MPISRTSTSVASDAFKIVTGSPCSLLKLRTLATTRFAEDNAATMRSLVEVFPTEPVTPMTTVDAGN